MPIRGTYPVIDQPEQITDPFDDTRGFSFRSLDGSTILEATGDEFLALWGVQGLDLPEPEVVEGEIPGMDGSVIDDIKIGSRKLFLPLWLGSNSGHLQYLQNRSRLRRLFNHRGVDYRAADGTFDLVAHSELGERSLRCQYLSGMGGDWAQDSSGAYWERLGLNFLAVRTYWYGERWRTPEIHAPAGTDSFARFPLRLSSSRAFGSDIPIVIDGEVDSWPRVDLVGPADSILIEAEGLSISIPAGLASGEVAIIDTNPRPGQTQASFSGVDDWARIAPSYTRAPLAPGLQLVTIEIEGATQATSAVVSGPTLWETCW